MSDNITKTDLDAALSNYATKSDLKAALKESAEWITNMMGIRFDEVSTRLNAHVEVSTARFDRLDNYIGEFKSEVIAKLKLAEETAAIRERLSKLEEAAMAGRIKALEDAERFSKH